MAERSQFLLDEKRAFVIEKILTLLSVIPHQLVDASRFKTVVFQRLFDQSKAVSRAAMSVFTREMPCSVRSIVVEMNSDIKHYMNMHVARMLDFDAGPLRWLLSSIQQSPDAANPASPDRRCLFFHQSRAFDTLKRSRQFATRLTTLEPLRWSSDLHRYWSLLQLARGLVFARLKTPLGNPQCTLEALAKHLKCEDRFVAGNFAQMLDFFEKQFFACIEGSMFIAGAPKASLQFFGGHRSACEEWFSRQHHEMLEAASGWGNQPYLVVRTSFLILQKSSLTADEIFSVFKYLLPTLVQQHQCDMIRAVGRWLDARAPSALLPSSDLHLGILRDWVSASAAEADWHLEDALQRYVDLIERTTRDSFPGIRRLFAAQVVACSALLEDWTAVTQWLERKSQLDERVCGPEDEDQLALERCLALGVFPSFSTLEDAVCSHKPVERPDLQAIFAKFESAWMRSSILVNLLQALPESSRKRAMDSIKESALDWIRLHGPDDPLIMDRIPVFFGAVSQNQQEPTKAEDSDDGLWEAVIRYRGVIGKPENPSPVGTGGHQLLLHMRVIGELLCRGNFETARKRLLCLPNTSFTSYAEEFLAKKELPHLDLHRVASGCDVQLNMRAMIELAWNMSAGETVSPGLSGSIQDVANIEAINPQIQGLVG